MTLGGSSLRGAMEALKEEECERGGKARGRWSE